MPSVLYVCTVECGVTKQNEGNTAYILLCVGGGRVAGGEVTHSKRISELESPTN